MSHSKIYSTSQNQTKLATTQRDSVNFRTESVGFSPLADLDFVDLFYINGFAMHNFPVN